MYQVTVRDHMMVAHSFRGAVFGPAQRLHGATFVVDVRFERPALDADGLVVDIGAAREALSAIVGAFNLRNLDDFDEFSGRNTTTEFMARVIFERMREAIAAGRVGPAARGVTRLAVTLAESNLAWGGYEAEL